MALIWDKSDPVRATPTTDTIPSTCTPFTLPSAGVIYIDSTSTISLLADAVYHPQCTETIGLSQADVIPPSTMQDLRDPFYASTLPQCFALAATTVIAYMLVIMLLITPRTFLSGGSVILGRRGFTNGRGASGGVGIGGRPWLQKVAALTVAVSLTIATADTFRVAENQYLTNNQNAKALQNEVLNSTELKVIRVISDTFLWLAQAQTLIRLFPRHREKVIIKWTAFALILLDVVFSVLNNFVFNFNNTRPRTFEDAIPALAYLFQLSLGLLYCAWVIYYGFTKRAYAFYHPNMRNICLVALLSVIAVIVPVVFFVLDISKPTLAGWGDYVRWVGAAAASVVVWEWVERIEALERNDKKDGVLGREVFDGDEMLEVTPAFDNRANRGDRGGGGRGGLNGGSSTGAVGSSWPGMSGFASRYRPGRNEPRKNQPQNRSRILGRPAASLNPSNWPLRPPPAATPISRTDTASAESTVYAIRYHPISESRGATEEMPVPSLPTQGGSVDLDAHRDLEAGVSDVGKGKDMIIETSSDAEISVPRTNAWEALQKANPFRRKDERLPREVSAHTTKIETPSDSDARPNKWDVLGRLEDFAAVQADRLRDKARPSHDLPSLPVTRIPAPARARTLEEITEELIDQDEAARSITRTTRAHTINTTPLPSTGDTVTSPVSSDPFAEKYVIDTSVTHRGSLTFAASVQRDMDRRLGEGTMSSPPLDDELESTPRSPIRRDMTRSNSLHSQPPNHLKLPVTRIPAPPRRPTPEE